MRTFVIAAALLVAGLNVLYGFLFGWGLAGGDGDPESRLADVSGRLLILAAAVAGWVALRERTGPGPVALAVMLLPAVLVLVGLAGTDGPRLREAGYALPFVAPPALLAVAGGW